MQLMTSNLNQFSRSIPKILAYGRILRPIAVFCPLVTPCETSLLSWESRFRSWYRQKRSTIRRLPYMWRLVSRLMAVDLSGLYLCQIVVLIPAGPWFSSSLGIHATFFYSLLLLGIYAEFQDYSGISGFKGQRNILQIRHDTWIQIG